MFEPFSILFGVCLIASRCNIDVFFIIDLMESKLIWGLEYRRRLEWRLKGGKKRGSAGDSTPFYQYTNRSWWNTLDLKHCMDYQSGC